MRFYAQMLTLLCSLFVSHLFAEEPDSIVFLKDLTFQSNYERDAFFSLSSTNGPDYAHLFISTDSCSSRDIIDINRSITNQIVEYSKNEKFH